MNILRILLCLWFGVELGSMLTMLLVYLMGGKKVFYIVGFHIRNSIIFVIHFVNQNFMKVFTKTIVLFFILVCSCKPVKICPTYAHVKTKKICLVK